MTEETKQLIEAEKALDSQKSITDVTIADVAVTIDKTKSYEEQAKDIVGMAAVVAAAKDEKTAQNIKDSKSKELVEESKSKAAKAEAERITGETEVQTARRIMYEELLELFGVKEHLPQWLMRIVVFLFTPFYIALLVVIGIPTGLIKFLIDCTDRIFVRYEDIGKERRAHVKAITWIFLIVLILGIGTLITLNILKII
jgi:hypothetical protein